MNRRAGVVALVVVSAASVVTPAAFATTDTPVVIAVTGAGHGFGMAMDGVEGEANAGWTHDRILSLFYPGTTTGHAGGTIRVGLTQAPVVSLSLPDGGLVSNAPRGAASGNGFPIVVSRGGRVSFRMAHDGIVIDGGERRASSRPTPSPHASFPPTGGVADTQPELVPTAPPPPPPPPMATPSPSPRPRPQEPSSGPDRGGTAPGAVHDLWVWGTGTPGLVRVDALALRYRGSIEVAARGGALSVVNHVDLETYISGIAEARGAGWPIEAMKSLAIAARTYAAARMTWFDSNHPSGYDICPTDRCQVYHGYDGEEPKMRQAAAETTGQIRTYGGRPILAMYHGDGGGQTESYARMADNGLDQYPYLRSVRYPYADPTHTLVRTTMSGIESALRASGTSIPGSLERVVILRRGDSPRVVRLGLTGSAGEKDIPGRVFASALGLGSTWFDFVRGGTASVVVSSGAPIVAQQAASSDVPMPRSAARPERWWIALLVGVLALNLLAAATLFRAPEPLPAPSPAA